MIITLDATKEQENSITPRNEFKSEVLIDDSSVCIQFRLKTKLPMKEVTFFQVMKMDEEDKQIPIIRLGLVDNNLYITYKDQWEVNHYTKITKYDIGKIREFEINIVQDYIEIGFKNFKTKETIKSWRFERPFIKYEYKCGLYSQTDEGYYELELRNFTMKG